MRSRDQTKSINILTPGQNGFISPDGVPGPHFADQLPLYTSFQYKSMQFFDPLKDHYETVIKVKESTNIYRDSFGVPHIFANNERDLALAAGYATAQDRLFQMDLFRLRATGRLAEFLNDDFPRPNMNYAQADKHVRRNGYTFSELTEILHSLPVEIQDALQNYTEGVNQYVEVVHSDPSFLPVEYMINQMLPQVWKPEDSIAILAMMGRLFGSAGGFELLNADLMKTLIQKYGKEQAEKIFQDILYRNDPAAPATIPPEEGMFPYEIKPGKIFYDWFPSHTAEKFHQEILHNQMIEEMLGIPCLASNAIAVSAQKSATGNALLYGGPQMGYSVPGIVLEMGLHSGGVQVRGMTFPGMGPYVLIGHGPKHAWTVTSGASDAVDTYAETINPLQHEQYLFNGKWTPMEKRTERIIVKSSLGRPVRNVVFEVFRTVHGPVVEWDEKKCLAYSIKRSYWKKEADMLIAFHTLNRSGELQAISHVIKDIPVSFNLIYANSAGHIAYWHLGKQPIRPEGIEDRLPVPGTGEYEWRGFVPFERMPHVINPVQGWLANWNNKPSIGWGNGDRHDIQWGKNHRVQALFDFLGTSSRISFQDLLQITEQVSFIDIRVKYFKPLLIQAITSTRKKNRKYTAVLKILKDWNDLRKGDEIYDTPAVAIFDTWWKQIMMDLFEAPFGHYRLPDFSPDMNKDHASMLLHVLEGRRTSVKLHFDYLSGRTRNAAIIKALDKALVNLEQQYGKDTANWRTAVIHTSYNHDGAGRVPEHIFMNRGTYCQVIEIKRDEDLK